MEVWVLTPGFQLQSVGPRESVLPSDLNRGLCYRTTNIPNKDWPTALVHGRVWPTPRKANMRRAHGRAELGCPALG